MIIEALVLGLVAAVIGIVAGVGIAVLLKALLCGFGIDLPSTSLQLQPRTIVVSLVIGVVVTPWRRCFPPVGPRAWPRSRRCVTRRTPAPTTWGGAR